MARPPREAATGQDAGSPGVSALESYLEHLGWVRADYVSEAWESPDGQLAVDLSEPDPIGQLAAALGRPRAEVYGEAVSFVRGALA